MEEFNNHQEYEEYDDYEFEFGGDDSREFIYFTDKEDSGHSIMEDNDNIKKDKEESHSIKKDNDSIKIKTELLLNSLFLQKQSNKHDCGVFAIANAMAIVNGQQPEEQSYIVSQMHAT